MKKLNLFAVFGREVKRVSVFGAGRTCDALIPLLLHSGYELTVRDDRPNLPQPLKSGVRYLLGKDSLSDVNEDLMILSPSVRRDRFFDLGIEKRTLLTSDAEIFFKSFKGKSFAVSGSSGKSTTSRFLYEFLSTGGSTHLIGNIGVPMTPTLFSSDIENAVCEISSFNLQYDEIRSYRALITNIVPNHLNWHRDLNEYTEAKRRLLYGAVEFMVNFDDEATREFAAYSQAFALYSLKFDYGTLKKTYKDKIIYTLSDFGIMRCGEPLIPRALLSHFARYDLYNLLAALSLSDGYRDDTRLFDALLSHKSLPHRNECFLTHRGVRFVDSSIDTSPDRTYETLSATDGQVVLLLGGRSKGEGYGMLLPLILEKCPLVFAFGEAREKIKRDLYCPALSGRFMECESFYEAVLSAIRLCGDGMTLLLSPASTSFDEFSSFEERGCVFKKIVKNATQG